MDMSNPYLMPAGLQDSRESIHSMSRSMRDEHDPYRPVAMLRYSTESSRPRHDNASQYSASTLHSTNEKVNLLAHAQKAPRSDPRIASPLSAPHPSLPMTCSSGKCIVMGEVRRLAARPA